MMSFLLSGVDAQSLKEKNGVGITSKAFQKYTIWFPDNGLSLSYSTKAVPYLSHKMDQKATLFIKPFSADDLPFFCMMESKVHRKTHMWIKLRAGSDENYLKMIKPSTVK